MIRVRVLIEKIALHTKWKISTISAYSTAANYDESTETSAKPAKDIPGPPSYPGIKAMWQYLPGGTFHGWDYNATSRYFHDQYGDIVRQELPGRTIIHLYNPDDFRTIYNSDDRIPKRIFAPILEVYFNRENERVQSFATSQGEEWYELRRACQKKLMKPKSVLSYLPQQAAIADDLAQLIRDTRNEDNWIADVREIMDKYSAEAISVVCFNQRLGATKLDHEMSKDASEYIQSVRDHNLIARKAEMQLPFYKYWENKVYKEFKETNEVFFRLARKYTSSVAERIRENPDATDGDNADLIPWLLANGGLNERQIFAVITDILSGGVQSTSSLEQFALYALATNPNVQKAAQKEIDAVYPKNSNTNPASGNEINFDKLPYLKAVVKETLRLYPASPGTGRTISKEVVCSGFRLPPESVVIMHHEITSVKDEYFEDAKTFRPERWLRDSEEYSMKHAFSYMPFGHGPRACIGKRFAVQEALLALMKILQNFEVEYTGSEDLKIIMQVSNTSLNALPFVFKDRS